MLHRYFEVDVYAEEQSVSAEPIVMDADRQETEYAAEPMEEGKQD